MLYGLVDDFNKNARSDNKSDLLSNQSAEHGDESPICGRNTNIDNGSSIFLAHVSSAPEAITSLGKLTMGPDQIKKCLLIEFLKVLEGHRCPPIVSKSKSDDYVQDIFTLRNAVRGIVSLKYLELFKEH